MCKDKAAKLIASVRPVTRIGLPGTFAAPFESEGSILRVQEPKGIDKRRN